MFSVLPSRTPLSDTHINSSNNFVGPTLPKAIPVVQYKNGSHITLQEREELTQGRSNLSIRGYLKFATKGLTGGMLQGDTFTESNLTSNEKVAYRILAESENNNKKDYNLEVDKQLQYLNSLKQRTHDKTKLKDIDQQIKSVRHNEGYINYKSYEILPAQYQSHLKLFTGRAKVSTVSIGKEKAYRITDYYDFDKPGSDNYWINLLYQIKAQQNKEGGLTTERTATAVALSFVSLFSGTFKGDLSQQRAAYNVDLILPQAGSKLTPEQLEAYRLAHPYSFKDKPDSEKDTNENFTKTLQTLVGPTAALGAYVGMKKYNLLPNIKSSYKGLGLLGLALAPGLLDAGYQLATGGVDKDVNILEGILPNFNNTGNTNKNINILSPITSKLAWLAKDPLNAVPWLAKQAQLKFKEDPLTSTLAAGSVAAGALGIAYYTNSLLKSRLSNTLSKETTRQVSNIAQHTKFNKLGLLSAIGLTVAGLGVFAQPAAGANAISSEYSKGKVTKVIDADTVVVNLNGNSKHIRLSGINAPEVAHPELFNASSFIENPIATFRKLHSQDYGDEAKNFVSNLLPINSEVTVRKLPNTSYERLVGEVFTQDGRSVNKELLKQGLAHAYSNKYKDSNVLTPEIEEQVSQNIINRKGLFSKDYIMPEDYEHGTQVNAKQFTNKQRSYVKAQYNLNKSGVSNTGWAPLYDDTGSSGYLLAPSQLGASYFYGVALHNQLMKQAGYVSMTTRGHNTGIGEVLYNMAANATGKGATQAGTAISRQYDKELYSAGIGMWFNENFAMPQGYGRLYKDEVGLLPSIAGGLGKMLDHSFLYYTSASSDLALSGQEYRDGLGYSPIEPRQGVFEGAFEKVSNFGISATGALGLYLVLGEPVNMLLSEGMKVETESVINSIFADSSKIRKDTVGNLLGGLRNNPALIATTFGLEFTGLSGDELKYQVALKMQKLQKQEVAFYSKENFNTTPYHFNAVFFREKAASLLNNTLKPFLLDYVNPFTPGGSRSDNFIKVVDSFIEEIRRPPDQKLVMAVNTSIADVNSPIYHKADGTEAVTEAERHTFHSYRNTRRTNNPDTLINNISAMEERISAHKIALQNTSSLTPRQSDLIQQELTYLQSAVKQEKAKLGSLRIELQHVGVERQTTVATSLQRMLEVIPLNPLHWRVFGGLNETQHYTAVGSIFSFEKASSHIRQILFNSGGFGELISQATVMRKTSQGIFVKDGVRTVDNVIKTVANNAVNKFGDFINKTNDLAVITKKYRAAERALGDAVSWDSYRGTTVHVSSGNPTVLMDAITDYDDYLKKQGGLTMEQLARADSYIQESNISRLTSKINSGLGSDVVLERARSKGALFAAAAMFTTLLANDLFQSTSGVSLTTQFLYAFQNAREGTKASVNFSGQRFVDLGGTGQNIAGSLVLTAGIVAASNRAALAMRKEGWVSYSMSQTAMDELTRDAPNAKGIYYRLERASHVAADLPDEKVTNWVLRKYQQASQPQGLRPNMSLTTDTILNEVKVFRKAEGEAFDRVGYRIVQGMQLINDGKVPLNTLIISSIGLLGIQGLKSSIGAVLNASKDTTGTVDPLIAGTIGGLAVGIKFKSPLGGILGALGSAAVTSAVNATGLKMFSIGGVGKEIGMMAQTSGQLEMFSRLVRNNPNASPLELQAGYYSSQMSKVLDIYKSNIDSGKQIQVVAKQVPLPFIQFFLAKRIEGARWNGDSLDYSNSKSYYSVGIQSSALMGMSLNTQLPFKLGPGGIMGVSYNENSNIADIWQGSMEIGATTGMAFTGSHLMSRGMSKLATKMGAKKAALYFDEMSDTINSVRNISNRVQGAGDLFLTTIARTLSIFGNDAYLLKQVMSNESELSTAAKATIQGSKSLKFTRNTALFLNAYGKQGIMGYVLGGVAASIGYQMYSSNQNQEVNQAQHGLFVGAASVASAGIFSGASYLNDKLSLKVYQRLTPGLSGIKTGLQSVEKNILASKFAKPYNLSKRYGMISATLLALTWVATDSRFGLALNMDKKVARDKNTGEVIFNADGTRQQEDDIVNKVGVMGVITLVGTPILAHVGRFGLTPGETVKRYGELLRSRANGTEKARSIFQRLITDRFLENDAKYIIETAGQQFRHLNLESTTIPHLQNLSEATKGSKNLLTWLHSDSKPITGTAIHNPSSKTIAQFISDELLEDTLPFVNGGGPLLQKQALYKSIGQSAEIANKVAIRLGFRKLKRVGIPAAIISSVAFTLLTSGNSSSEKLDNYFINADQAGGIQKVLADVVRLTTGRDYIDMRLIDGKEFGRPGLMKVTGSSMIMAKTAQYNGFVKALQDIKSMYVFDEPNAFFTLGLGGVTFRAGDKGTRVSYYAQMQSAGQDVSTAVYSMSSAFAFKEMLSGAMQQNLITDIATKGLTHNPSYKDKQLAAVKILNITSSLQPLKRRRKYSKVNDSVVDLASKDSLLASILTYREQMDAHMSYQPGASLFSEMLRSSIDLQKEGTGNILKALSNANPSQRSKLIKQLYQDKFGNVQRTLRHTNTIFFGYDFKSGKSKGTSNDFDDESQWSETQALSLSDSTKRDNNNNPLGFLQYLWQPLGGNLPSMFSWALMGGLALQGGSWLASVGARYAQHEEVSLLRHNTESFYTHKPTNKRYTVSTSKLPNGTTVTEAANASGAATAGSSKPKLEIKSNNSIYKVSSLFDTSEEAIRGLQFGVSNLQASMDEIFEAGVANGWGLASNKSFYSHMSGDFVNTVSDIAKNAQSQGTLVSAFRNNLASAYEQEFEVIANKIFGTMVDGNLVSTNALLLDKNFDIELNGKSYKLFDALNEDVTDFASRNAKLFELRGQFMEDIKHHIGSTLDSVLDNSKATGSIVGNQLVNNVFDASVEEQMLRLNQHVLENVSKGSALGSLRTTLAGALIPEDARSASLIEKVLYGMAESFGGLRSPTSSSVHANTPPVAPTSTHTTSSPTSKPTPTPTSTPTHTPTPSFDPNNITFTSNGSIYYYRNGSFFDVNNSGVEHEIADLTSKINAASTSVSQEQSLLKSHRKDLQQLNKNKNQLLFDYNNELNLRNTPGAIPDYVLESDVWADSSSTSRKIYEQATTIKAIKDVNAVHGVISGGYTGGYNTGADKLMSADLNKYLERSKDIFVTNFNESNAGKSKANKAKLTNSIFHERGVINTRSGKVAFISNTIWVNDDFGRTGSLFRTFYVPISDFGGSENDATEHLNRLYQKAIDEAEASKLFQGHIVADTSALPSTSPNWSKSTIDFDSLDNSLPPTTPTPTPTPKPIFDPNNFTFTSEGKSIHYVNGEFYYDYNKGIKVGIEDNIKTTEAQIRTLENTISSKIDPQQQQRLQDLKKLRNQLQHDYNKEINRLNQVSQSPPTHTPTPATYESYDDFVNNTVSNPKPKQPQVHTDPTDVLGSQPGTSSGSPIIKSKGRSSLFKGAWKAVQGLMVIQDMFTAFDIMSSASRVANAYDSPYTRTEDLKHAKRELGMVVTNSIGLGFVFGAGSTYALGAIAGLAGGLTLGTGLLIGAGLLAAGLTAAALWKNAIKPGFEAMGKSQIFKDSANGIKSLYYGISDGVGEFLGGTLPEAVGGVFGKRGKSTVTMAAAGGIAAFTMLLSLATTGIVAGGAAAVAGSTTMGAVLATAGIGILSGGTVLAAVGIGAVIGGILGLIAPKETASAFTSISRAISKIPFIQGFVTDPDNGLLIQDRFRKGWRGSPLSFGRAKEVIQQEFRAALNASEDYTGKSTVNMFVDSSLYGYGGNENSYTSGPRSGIQASLWAIDRPSNLISTDIQRELEIRAQNHNQATVGNFNWRSRLREADNRKDILRQEKEFRQYKIQLMLQEAKKQQAAINKVTQVTHSRVKVGVELECLQAAYVSAVCEQRIQEQQTKPPKVITSISVNKQNLSNPAQSSIEKDKQLTLGISPTNKRVSVSSSTSSQGASVTIKSQPDEVAVLQQNTTKRLLNSNSNNPLLTAQLQTLSPDSMLPAFS